MQHWPHHLIPSVVFELKAKTHVKATVQSRVNTLVCQHLQRLALVASSDYNCAREVGVGQVRHHQLQSLFLLFGTRKLMDLVDEDNAVLVVCEYTLHVRFISDILRPYLYVSLRRHESNLLQNPPKDVRNDGFARTRVAQKENVQLWKRGGEPSVLLPDVTLELVDDRCHFTLHLLEAYHGVQIFQRIGL